MRGKRGIKASPWHGAKSTPSIPTLFSIGLERLLLPGESRTAVSVTRQVSLSKSPERSGQTSEGLVLRTDRVHWV